MSISQSVQQNVVPYADGGTPFPSCLASRLDYHRWVFPLRLFPFLHRHSFRRLKSIQLFLLSLHELQRQKSIFETQDSKRIVGIMQLSESTRSAGKAFCLQKEEETRLGVKIGAYLVRNQH